MSSMRNAVQRRNHKERAQPQERARWGLLEKRKDYSLRAQDHNEKKRKLKALQQKATERNEDEFYFGMMRSQTQGGKKIAQRGEDNAGGGGKVLSRDVVKLMKTQDSAYLRTVLQSTRRAREKLEEAVVLLERGVSSLGKKTLFGEDEDGTYKLLLDTPASALVKPKNLPSMDDGEERGDEDEVGMMGRADIDSDEEDEDDRSSHNHKLTPQERTAKRKRQHNIDVQRRQLATLRAREKSLQTALREVEDQRARMSGTAGGVTKAGVKFRVRERRR